MAMLFLTRRSTAKDGSNVDHDRASITTVIRPDDEAALDREGL
jgi:hypothetical protein